MRMFVSAACAFAIAALAGPASSDELVKAPSSSSATIMRLPPEDAPARGPRLAPVTVEVFCTYTHPHCASLDENLKALSARHPRRLRIVYRQLPLPYRDGQLLAEAALEAWAQGRFLELNDELHALRGRAALADVEAAARRAGMDVQALKDALASGRHRARVAEDGLRKELFELGTPPAMAWNGRPTSAPATLEGLEELYDRAHADARARLADGVPLARLYPLLVAEEARRRAEATRRSPGATRLDDNVEPRENGIDLHARRREVAEAEAPARGDEAAPVRIVVFSDYQCPFSRRLLETLAKIEGLYPRQVRVVLRQFPLPAELHPHARQAAELAACAAWQDRFWALHDRLARGPARLRSPELARQASEAGLSAERLARDRTEGRCAARVEDDIDLGRELGVTATPTLFVNGLMVVGAVGLSELRLLVEQELDPGFLETAMGGR